MSHDEPPDPKSRQHADLALKLKAEMLVLSGEDLTAEMWRALARTDITAEELVALARSMSHPEDGPLSRAVTSDFGDDIPPLLRTVCRTLLLEGRLALSFKMINLVCGKMFPERLFLIVSLPLLAELIIDLCASWEGDPLGERCTGQLMQLEMVLIAQIKTAAAQTLNAHEQDRMILAAARLAASCRANGTRGRPEGFWVILNLLAARLPRERQNELWEAAGLQRR